MPRPKRLNIPGIAQHVIQRGNNRSPCFVTSSDYLHYLQTLRESCEKHECSLHAYVLMTNHVHMLITPLKGDAVSKLMMDLGRKYVRYFNDTKDRTGTLWEGRFKSSLIDSVEYCLACYRYIEMNPVRAKMVETPGEYEWSSYRTNALGSRNRMIKPHSNWLALGRDLNERTVAYRRLFDIELNQEKLFNIRYGIVKGLPVGSKEFKRNIERELGIKLGTGKIGRARGSKNGAGYN